MAIAQQNELIDRIQGSIGDRTFRWRNGVQIIQRRSSPGIHRTAKALQNKNRFAYSAGFLGRQTVTTKNRLRQLVQHLEENFFNYFQRQFLPLTGSEFRNINLPTPDPTASLGTVHATPEPPGHVTISWTARSQSPTAAVIFIDGIYDNGEWLGPAHFSVDLSRGSTIFTGSGWIGMMFRSPFDDLNDPNWGPITIGKWNLNYAVKPTFG